MDLNDKIIVIITKVTNKRDWLFFCFFCLYSVKTMCLMYSSPYAKYARDTLSYIVLALLHYALCLSPSTIAFGRLEWAILIFFVGRCLVEGQQIFNIRKRIKRRRKKDEVKDGKRTKTKWIGPKTVLIYLRYIVILQNCFVELQAAIYNL